MNKRLFVTFFTLILIIYVDGKKSFKSGRSSGAGRSSSRKTSYNPQPVPTSLSYPQASAPKPSLFGWQEKTSNAHQKPKQAPPNTQTHSYPQAKPPASNPSHSYPSSQSGMSGNNQAKQPSYHQESVQKNSASQNQAGHSYPASPGQQSTNNQPSHSYPASPGQQATNNQPGHSYPASPGLSGSPGSGYPSQTGTHQQGSNYPQGTGLSGAAGAGAAPPPYPGTPNKQYNAGTYQNNNPGNTYQHPPPPPPYTNVGPNYGSNYGGYNGMHGSNYGGYGGQGSNYGGYGGSYNPGPQMPGYFGNYGNKGFGGMSRPGGGVSTLAGVGIAGAGVGTILTGLALWNLARSTGKTHHTVVYDNRGQPVAVAPENNTTSETDSILADLVNCSLSISNGNNTEVLAIPCAIATSFRPDADVKDLGTNNNANEDTKCTVTVVNKEGREFMTTINCAILLNSAKENNVTEPPLVENMNIMTDSVNGTVLVPPEAPLTSEQAAMVVPPAGPLSPNQPSALSLAGDVSADNIHANLNCDPQPGEVRDPLNPCFAITHNITVAPLPTTEKIEDKKEK